MFDRVLKSPIMRTHNALVAQLDRVLGYEPSGRRFESSRVRHIEKNPLHRQWVFFVCNTPDCH